MINWDIDKGDMVLIRAIIKRANDCGLPLDRDSMKLDMDITACHLNGCPLNLSALLNCLDADFHHDIIGIQHHIDRDTGKLLDCFVPRYAK